MVCGVVLCGVCVWCVVCVYGVCVWCVSVWCVVWCVCVVCVCVVCGVCVCVPFFRPQGLRSLCGSNTVTDRRSPRERCADTSSLGAELTRRLQVCAPQYQFICKCGHSVKQEMIRKLKAVRCSCQRAFLGQTLLSKGHLTASPTTFQTNHSTVPTSHWTVPVCLRAEGRHCCSHRYPHRHKVTHIDLHFNNHHSQIHISNHVSFKCTAVDSGEQLLNGSGGAAGRFMTNTTCSLIKTYRD